MGLIPPPPAPRPRLSQPQRTVVAPTPNCRNCGAPPRVGTEACTFCGTPRPVFFEDDTDDFPRPVARRHSGRSGRPVVLLSTPTPGRPEAV